MQEIQNEEARANSKHIFSTFRNSDYELTTSC